MTTAGIAPGAVARPTFRGSSIADKLEAAHAAAKPAKLTRILAEATPPLAAALPGGLASTPLFLASEAAAGASGYHLATGGGMITGDRVNHE